jgi:hypothetical protein
MSFASSGNGSSDHLTAELFWQQTGTSGLHIPYKGGGPAMSDLLGGQVDASLHEHQHRLPNIKGGKLRALAITSAKRSPLLPDVPTMDELGVKGVTVYSWQAVRSAQGPAGRHQGQAARSAGGGLNDPRSRPSCWTWASRSWATRPSSSPPSRPANSRAGRRSSKTGKITAD